MRAAGNIAAVGSYGTPLGFGGLGLFVRSSAGTWGRAPFSLIGGRSVGIDVKQLADGRIAVARTSFLDDALLLTLVDGTNGEILGGQAIDLPAGCTGPEHCSFVREDNVNAILVSCNTSDNAVPLPIDYDSE